MPSKHCRAVVMKSTPVVVCGPGLAIVPEDYGSTLRSDIAAECGGRLVTAKDAVFQVGAQRLTLPVCMLCRQVTMEGGFIDGE